MSSFRVEILYSVGMIEPYKAFNLNQKFNSIHINSMFNPTCNVELGEVQWDFFSYDVRYDKER